MPKFSTSSLCDSIIENATTRVSRVPILDGNAERRYWTSVVKYDGCWLWNGRIDRGGYGRFYANGRNFLAHRVSWILHFGEISFDENLRSLFVCHHCDIRNCVNPSHLFLGTNSDNMRDKMTKGRFARTVGEKHPSAILMDADVIEILNKRKLGQGASDLAREYKIGVGSMGKILARKSWRHLSAEDQ